MPGAAGDLAALAGERIRRSIASEPFRVGGSAGQLEVTVSIGVASSQGDDESAETLLKRADEALYLAKHAGRNRVMGKTTSAAA